MTKKKRRTQYCGRCGVLLTVVNSYKRADGKFIGYCRDCNRDVTFMKYYKKKSIEAVDATILNYKRYIYLLECVKKVGGEL